MRNGAGVDSRRLGNIEFTNQDRIPCWLGVIVVFQCGIHVPWNQLDDNDNKHFAETIPLNGVV